MRGPEAPDRQEQVRRILRAAAALTAKGWPQTYDHDHAHTHPEGGEHAHRHRHRDGDDHHDRDQHDRRGPTRT